MIRALRSEWYKLMRRGMILGGLGTMILLAMLAVTLIFVNAPAPGAAPAAGGPRGPDGGLPSTVAVAQSGGMVLAFTFSGGLLSLVGLVLCATTVANEYRDGTLKVLLSREPRRLNLLAGKLIAMLAFLAIGVAAAFVAQTIVAAIIASARGIDTSAWWTQDGVTNAAGVVARTWVDVGVHGLLGAVLAVLFRAAAPAIGIGVGYTLIGENLILLVWKDGQKWLPGQVLQAFTRGGTSVVSLTDASVLVAAYAALFLVVSGASFWRRDVVG
jgi:ABC-2 type transport system permease protein